MICKFVLLFYCCQKLSAFIFDGSHTISVSQAYFSAYILANLYQQTFDVAWSFRLVFCWFCKLAKHSAEVIYCFMKIIFKRIFQENVVLCKNCCLFWVIIVNISRNCIFCDFKVKFFIASCSYGFHPFHENRVVKCNIFAWLLVSENISAKNERQLRRKKS